jgi:hypothetical protein
VFGLIHGFGFAAGLLNNPIPSARLAELLVGFNLGSNSASYAWSSRCRASSRGYAAAADRGSGQ